jgi:hypothetical protein
MADIFERSEEAIGMRTPKAKMPYGPKERIRSREKARPWTGPKPWAEKNKAEIPQDKGDGSANEL